MRMRPPAAAARAAYTSPAPPTVGGKLLLTIRQSLQEVAHGIGVGIGVIERFNTESCLDGSQDGTEIIRRVINIAALHRRTNSDQRHARARPPPIATWRRHMVPRTAV